MVAWVEDINALLIDAREQMEVAEGLHNQALDDPRVRNRFKSRVKNVLENQRSALDYLAAGLTSDFGTGKRGKIYYPLAQSESEFASLMEGNMPGVATAKPAIADVVEQHQPYQPHHEALRELNQLAREQKHNRLTWQIVRETYQCRVTEKETGAYVQWHGLAFEVGVVVARDPAGGTIRLQPEPDRDESSPKLMEFGVGPTGVEVFGVPIDPSTQRPFLDERLSVESGPLHQWWFVDPHKPVLEALSHFDQMVTAIINDVLQVAFNRRERGGLVEAELYLNRTPAPESLRLFEPGVP